MQNIIVCDDLKIMAEAEQALTYEESNMPLVNGEANPWNNLGQLYRELNADRWNRAGYASMEFEDGSRDGWRCYTTQPIYTDWSDWGSCNEGKRTRTRECQGTCHQELFEDEDC